MSQKSGNESSPLTYFVRHVQNKLELNIHKSIRQIDIKFHTNTRRHFLDKHLERCAGAA